jgi:TolA-binding protein
MKCRMSPFPPLCLLFLVAIAPLAAQGAASGGGAGMVGLPIVSQLRVGVLGSEARLSWLDIPSGPASYIVYRSKLPFNSASFSKAERIADVPSGSQAYTDSPPPGTAYYYAVFASGSGGRPVLRFKSGDNTTMFAATVGPRTEGPAQTPMAASLPTDKAQVAPPQETAAPVMPATPPETAAVSPPPASESVTDKPAGSPGPEPAAAQADSPPPPAPPTTVAPMAKPVEAQSNALPPPQAPGSGEAAPTAASAAPQPPALEAPQQVAGDGPDSIAIQGGATGTDSVEPDRSTPLPSFLYGAGSPGAGGLSGGPTRATSGEGLSSETRKAISALDLAQAGSATDFPTLRILAVPGGAAGQEPASSALATAVDAIRAGDWDMAGAKLDVALKDGLGKAELAQAHYYRGACLARTGRYRDALFEFLEARGLYPAETKPWVDFLIERLGRS